MLAKLIKTLWSLRNSDHIPKLPRGMLAERYTTYSRDDARVMARLGTRSPAGVKRALKRAKVQTVAELIEHLDHYKAAHRFTARLSRMIGRALDAEDTPPHRREILADARRARRKGSTPELKQRIESVVERFRDDS